MKLSTKEYVPNEAAAERRAKARKALNYQEKHPEIDAQQPKKPKAFEEKYLAFQLLREQGITAEKAGQLLGYKPRTAYSIERRIRERGQKLSLVSEKRIRLLHRAADRLLAGKPVGAMERVTGSDVLGAMKLVADRAEPARQAPEPETFSFTRVCLDEMKLDHPSYSGNLVLPDHGSPLEPAGVDLTPCIPHKNFGPDEEPA